MLQSYASALTFSLHSSSYMKEDLSIRDHLFVLLINALFHYVFLFYLLVIWMTKLPHNSSFRMNSFGVVLRYCAFQFSSEWMNAGNVDSHRYTLKIILPKNSLCPNLVLYRNTEQPSNILSTVWLCSIQRWMNNDV